MICLSLNSKKVFQNETFAVYELGIKGDECYFIHCFLTIPYHFTQHSIYMSMFISTTIQIFCTTSSTKAIYLQRLGTIKHWEPQGKTVRRNRIEKSRKTWFRFCYHCPNSEVSFSTHPWQLLLLTILGKLCEIFLCTHSGIQISVSKPK